MEKQMQQASGAQGQQSAPVFTVRTNTLGKLEMLGLILVLTDQDAEGYVVYRQLEGEHAGYEDRVNAASVQRISGKPGSAKNQENQQESELDKARRLAGFESQPSRAPRGNGQNGQGQQRSYDSLRLGRKPYGANVSVVYRHDGSDQLVIRISRTCESRGLSDVPKPTLVEGALQVIPAIDRQTKKSIPGKWHSVVEYALDFGDGGPATDGTKE